MAQTLATPGVYIDEKSSFPNSTASIPTAVPAFIGYTERTVRDGQSLINKPVRISSLAEFHNIFGGGFQAPFAIQAASGEEADFEVEGRGYQVVPENNSRFIFYDSIRLFFANGGSTCYIISVGSYYSSVAGAASSAASSSADKNKKGDATPAAPAKTSDRKVNAITKKALQGGLDSLVSHEEPTILVIPEAVMLEEADCYGLQQQMLMHCGLKIKNRFAIIDVYNGFQSRTYDKNDVITRFREGVGSNFLAYGAAYYPYVYTSIVQNDELSYRNISNLDVLEDVLSKEADSGDKKKSEELKAEIKRLSQSGVDAESLNQTLTAISPAYKKIMQKVKRVLNILPPSAGMAGLYSAVDATRGVWKAPANVSYGSAISPAVNLTHDDQEDLNVTPSGKSINAIRSFIGEGTLVWGARTLDGNSGDWKFINVRRTVSFIEQSIKYAAKPYVYESNSANTWILIRSMINSFLNNLWKQGGLVGTTPDAAYEVQIGLGTTMTPADILDGIMRITVKVAVSRPAEFIVITFEQKMQDA
ncbi:hypothetical protein GCM10009122_53710 [Fulvivirga kasyanovii]|uniref:Phage tail sheath family protein n=1 Tax=Fulvivirga kasyanovii TaxID=396812 RepID=A0ABW9RVG5_9BACT|nr:phage tail sheath C-terminal domain-containing protein [Fulvivirga kasyanovii]MTI27701.1 phage tail sheath family protein [Fulvivirga kasyanovii]